MAREGGSPPAGPLGPPAAVGMPEPREPQPAEGDGPLERALLEVQRAEARLTMLLDVSAGLAAAYDTAAVVATICDVVGPGLRASTVYLGRVDETLREISTLGSRGMPATVLEPFATFPLDAPLPASAAVRTRTMVTFRDLAERDAMFPVLRGVPMGARSYVVVPMLAQERCVGVLALGWEAERMVGPTDRALLEAIASQCAQALERAQLYEDEAAARRRAERLAERLTILQDISTRLAEARHSADVAEVITSYAAAGVGATCALLRRLDPEHESLVVVASRGLDPARAAALAPVPVAARAPVADAVRELRPVTVSSEVDRDEQYPHLRGTPMGRPLAYVALPLVADDRAVGVLVLGWDQERSASGTDIAFLLALARQSAQALERAWLYEAEQLARHAAENTASRLRLQQDLTARLSESVDTDAVADVILRYATSALGARGAVLHRVDERSRSFELLASHGTPVDPAYRNVPLAAALPICDAVRQREPVLVAEAAGADAPAAGPSTIFVVVPLLLEERAVGALSVTWSAAVEYGTADAEFLEALASQCAQALDRARLYDETRSVARTLQGSLLPTRPPAIPGLEVAVRYRPISRRNEVGGDFYDVFRIAPGRWGVVIGDVSGKGVPAASLTALARYTVRAAAKRESSPADVLRFLNETMLEASAGAERFATVAYLDVTLSGDGASARLAVGGHPLPVLRRASGEVLPVGSPGMAIGLLPMADVDDTELRLDRGDTLVLYTDGVAEARSPEGEFAGELVEHVLRVGGAPDVETVADRIERATLDFQAGDPRDDLAVVVLRVPEGADVVRTAGVAVTLECDRASVAQARRVVGEFLAGQGLAGLPAVFDVAVLLTSEVVTNAVLHAQTAVGLRVSAVADRLRVEVTDGHPGRPVRRDARTDSSNGRGLLLLDRLAAGWDVRRTPDGKLVWFELDLPG